MYVRDCWQIAFVMLNRFCLLSKSPQNQKKNKCSFYTAFQVLEVLLRKICRIHPLIFYFLFLLAFTSADIIFHKFLKLHSAWGHSQLIVRFASATRPNLELNNLTFLGWKKKFNHCRDVVKTTDTFFFTKKIPNCTFSAN